jgi:hypothetical protein
MRTVLLRRKPCFAGIDPMRINDLQLTDPKYIAMHKNRRNVQGNARKTHRFKKKIGDFLS